MKMNTGVYCLRNKVNNKRYIGSAAISFSVREKRHIRALEKGTHGNKHLQAAWNKYGRDNFEFLIIERCLPSECLTREAFWIAKFRSADKAFGYNKLLTGKNWLGAHHTQQTKDKMSLWPRTPALRAKISEANRNRTLSTESRAKISESLKGNTRSVGRKLSDETRKKMSESHTGKKLKPHSAETKAKIAESVRRARAKKSGMNVA